MDGRFPRRLFSCSLHSNGAGGDSKAQPCKMLATRIPLFPGTEAIENEECCRSTWARDPDLCTPRGDTVFCIWSDLGALDDFSRDGIAAENFKRWLSPSFGSPT